MLVPSAKAGGIFALYRKKRIVMPIFTNWRKSANLFFADWRTSLIYSGALFRYNYNNKRCMKGHDDSLQSNIIRKGSGS